MHSCAITEVEGNFLGVGLELRKFDFEHQKDKANNSPLEETGFGKVTLGQRSNHCVPELLKARLLAQKVRSL